MTVCDDTSAPGRHTGCPQAQVSVKQKRHGEHDGVTVTIAGGFRSTSYDLSILITSDVRALMTSDAQHSARCQASPAHGSGNRATALAIPRHAAQVTHGSGFQRHPTRSKPDPSG